jgi:hypothetical protein
VSYGHGARAFEIYQLTTRSYKERLVPMHPPIVADGSGWNADGMHQVSPLRVGPHRWLAAVDGLGEVVSLDLSPGW